jgi:hypothetical protein
VIQLDGIKETCEWQEGERQGTCGAPRMKLKRRGTSLALMLLLCSIVLVLTHAAQQNRTLVITGYAGEIPVVGMGGHPYVEIEALTQLTNGSLSFKGNQIVLTMPTSTNVPAAVSSANQPAPPAFSREFLTALIEQMSIIREWRSTLHSAAQNGYPVTNEWMTSFSDRAEYSLRLVSVTASTDSERKTLELITNEFNNMKKLSDRFVEAKKSRRYMPTNSLDDDPLDRKILSCEHSLAAVAASRQFADDGSCH